MRISWQQQLTVLPTTLPPAAMMGRYVHNERRLSFVYLTLLTHNVFVYEAVFLKLFFTRS